MCDSYGNPLLSWRVLLLPYLEQKELCAQFHFDEPWDSPHNIELLPRIPEAYAPPSGKAWMVPAHHTVCKAFVGRGAGFEPLKELTFADFPNGTSNTFLVVEAGVPVPWTKPEDLEFDPDGPLPDMTCLFSDMFRACMADGSVRHVPKETSEATLRAAITRNGREPPHW